MVDSKRQTALRRCLELFFFAYRDFTSRPDRILEKRGLGRVHHRIIYFVGRDPGLSVAALLKTLAVSKQALHAPLRQLVAMKLVSVQTASHDGRVKKLDLTPEGRDLEARLSGTQMEHLETVFRKAGAVKESAWREIMEEMAGKDGSPGD